MTLPGEFVDPNPPATLAAALARPNFASVVLAEVTCGRYEPVWALYSGTTWSCVQGDTVTGVKFNGSSVTLVADAATVVSTAGSWYWAQAAQLVYVHLPLGEDPGAAGNTIETFLLYRFSTKPTDVGGYAWDERIADLPALSTRIPDSFSGTFQTGGGRLTLVNDDHFFDSQFSSFASVSTPGRLRQNWDAGSTVLKLGAAGLPWSEFVTLATLANTSVSYDQNFFVIDLKEYKVVIDVPYPLTVYTLAAYPSIRKSDVGRAVQVAFGVNLGRVPVCTDTVNREFRVAGHPILSFDGVRVLNNSTGVWNTINFRSVDEPNGLFTLNASDWSDGQEVVVDFSAWVRDDGSLADNPAEVALALLNDVQQPVNGTDFETARLWFDAGYYGNSTRNRVSVASPSLYLDTQVSLLATLEGMMQQVRAYLLVDEFGNFSMKPWRTYPVSGLPQIVESDDLFLPGLTRQTNNNQGSLKISAQVVNYATRAKEGISSVVSYQVPQQQYSRNNPKPVFGMPVDSLFANQSDALYLAQSLVNEFSTDPAIYSGTLNWRPFTWKVGQHVNLVTAQHGQDTVLEIIATSLNLKDMTVSLTFGNLRGFEEASGFLVNDTDLTPLGASLAWPAGGQIPGDESQYRRHQAAHWHNDHDNATDTPLTALDHITARWF